MMAESRLTQLQVVTLARIVDGKPLLPADLQRLGAHARVAQELAALPNDDRSRLAYDTMIDAGLTEEEVARVAHLDKVTDRMANATLGLNIANGAALFDKQFPPLEFLAEGLIARGYCGMLAGRPKSGKSWLVLQLAQSLDVGQPFLGKATHKCRVLYCALEDGERRINHRLHVRQWRPENTHFVYDGLQPFDGDGIGLDQLIHGSAGFDLVIIDTLIATLTSRTDERDNTSMAAIMNKLANFAHESNRAVMIVHHTRKGESDDPFVTIRGAGAIRGAYDVGIVLQRKNKEAEATLNIECRDFEPADMTIRFDATTGWSYAGGIEEIANLRAKRAVVTALEKLGNRVTTRQIAEHLDVREQTVREQLERAKRIGLVRRELDPNTTGKKRPYLWSLASAQESGPHSA
jgi:hypothetical protein